MIDDEEENPLESMSDEEITGKTGPEVRAELERLKASAIRCL
jgi:hypothetical protein